MPDQQNVNFTEGCKRFDEAIRAIEKYMYNAEKEPNALLDPTLDKHNGYYYINPCMYHEKGARKITKGLKEFYKQKTGREAKSNTSICTSIITMPKEFIQAHYDLNDREYVLMEKFVQEEKMNSDELAEVKKIQEKMVHIEWTTEEMKEIHMYFKAMEKAYCITAGIKGCEVREGKNGSLIEDYSNSDILWSISHLSESWPHLHLGFLPMSYIKEEEMVVLEKYEKDKEERNAQVEELVASGISPKDAAKMVPVVKQPKVLYGNINRKIEANEKPIGCSVKKYPKGYLHALNRRLEQHMLEQGIETKIANGKGNQFDLAKTGKQERFEESTKDKMIEALQLRTAELEEAATRAIYEKETAEAKATASMKAAAKAAEEKAELVKQNESLKQERTRLLETIGNLQMIVKKLLSKVFAPLFPKLYKAVTNREKEAVLQEVMEITSSELLGATDKIKEEVVSSLEKQREYNPKTFNRNDTQQRGVMVSAVKKHIFEEGNFPEFKEEISPIITKFNIEDNRILRLCLEDWTNEEKYRELYETLPEEEYKAFFKPAPRAKRALEYAKECIELGMDAEGYDEMEQG